MLLRAVLSRKSQPAVLIDDDADVLASVDLTHEFSFDAPAKPFHTRTSAISWSVATTSFSLRRIIPTLFF